MLLELPGFEHIDVKDVAEAVFYLRKYGDKAQVIAGATDLLSLMKDHIQGPKLKIPEVLLNIKTIPELCRITYDEEGGIRIGSAVTLNRLETSEIIRTNFSLLSQAARQIGTTQIRYMGTIGGNLCQRPRCIYFRHPHFPCYKKGGVQCYAATGEHRYYHSILKKGKCAMAHPSDLAPALAALKAKVIIACAEGEREVPLLDFYLGPDHIKETRLESGEFLTEIRVPNLNGNAHHLFLKQGIRHSTDFALGSVAIVARIAEGICEDMRIVLGGVAPFPYAASMAEELVKGRKLNEELISQAAEGSVGGAHPLPANRYKVPLMQALVRRALTSIWQGSMEE